MNDDPALALGLEPWKAALLRDLAGQMDRLSAVGAEAVPPVALLAIARYLDEIELTPHLVGAEEAGVILGVGAKRVADFPDQYPGWMTPLIETRTESGKIIERLWIRRKVEAFARIRKDL